MDLKLRQYEQGKRSATAWWSARGIAGLNRVWELPSRMPTLAELDDPAALAVAHGAGRRLAASCRAAALDRRSNAGSAIRSVRCGAMAATLCAAGNVRSVCHKVGARSQRFHAESAESM